MLKDDFLKFYRPNLASHGSIVSFLETIKEPGFHAILVFRFSQWSLQRNIILKTILFPIQMILSDLIKICWGIDIGKSAKIGPGFKIEHFGCIIVSGGAVIGANVSISQGVTIGLSGKGDKCGVPVIGDNVYIAPGAKIFGKIRIGNNAKIGANAVVYKNIPDNAIVANSPGFEIISFNGNFPAAKTD